MGNVCCLVSDSSGEAGAQNGKPRSKGSEISQALAAAEQELKQGGARKFGDVYSVGKIIGHGAFAKVSVCTHTASQEEFAVKSLGKNYEDLHKQRRGERARRARGLRPGAGCWPRRAARARRPAAPAAAARADRPAAFVPCSFRPHPTSPPPPAPRSAEVIKEIAIMRMLQEHPNVAKLIDVFEDPGHFMLVLELCSGGELFDQIISKVRRGAPGPLALALVVCRCSSWTGRPPPPRAAARRPALCRAPAAASALAAQPSPAQPPSPTPRRPRPQGHFSERDAAEKMRCLLDFAAFAHAKGVMHRDLKPENILLSSQGPEAQIRVIDFGTSEFCGDGAVRGSGARARALSAWRWLGSCAARAWLPSCPAAAWR
jgi:serine/threonine protein kinase